MVEDLWQKVGQGEMEEREGVGVVETIAILQEHGFIFALPQALHCL